MTGSRYPLATIEQARDPAGNVVDLQATQQGDFKHIDLQQIELLEQIAHRLERIEFILENAFSAGVPINR